MSKISVVINTLNEEKNLPRSLSSIKDFADEIIVCDMYSDDKTIQIAKKFGAKIISHERTNYVEPARNFAISKAAGDWILVLDADEEVPETLARVLKEIIKDDSVDFVSIPRKNIIFDKWVKNSRWWPDYLVRFFQRGKVKWSRKIHQPPEIEGKEYRLEAQEENAIIHHNYGSVSQYIERLDRYTTVQAEQLVSDGYAFSITDLIKKPANEFLGRFFAGDGYKDGLHGLTLSILQAFSEFIVYLKVWEREGFKEKDVSSFSKLSNEAIHDYLYWVIKKNPNLFDKLQLRIKSLFF